jgi:N4-bis(aminopropyl)spermidine synthase
MTEASPLALVRKTADAAGVLTESLVALLELLEPEGRVRVADAARQAGLPRSALRLVVAALPSFLRVEGDACVATPAGRDLARELGEERRLRAALVEERAARARVLLAGLESRREPSDRALDQFRATPETSVARAMLAESHHSVQGRRIVLLGDNDLTSLALAILGGAARIAVLELDPSVVELLESVAAREGLALECHRLDLREHLPKSLRGRFDVLFTDPPYTVNGVTLFLSRGAELARARHTVAYLSYGSSLRARERELRVQRAVLDLGWLVYEVRPRFNAYFAAGSIGSRSSLYRLLRTPRTRSAAPGRFTPDIYTGRHEA